ncbi:hypothetical protein GQ600_7047 [Phytophthora cactorum]|nr:hypothetical protein GQ600_7047 [Phytophthora cactorum]
MCVYAWSSLICESEEACPLTVPIQRPHAFASVPIELTRPYYKDDDYELYSYHAVLCRGKINMNTSRVTARVSVDLSQYEYITGFSGFHEFVEFTAEDVGTLDSCLSRAATTKWCCSRERADVRYKVQESDPDVRGAERGCGSAAHGAQDGRHFPYTGREVGDTCIAASVVHVV